VTQFFPNYWIENQGDTTIIGVQPIFAIDPRASIQHNVFAPANISIVYSFGTATNLQVSGNYFGYDLNGGVSSLFPSPGSSAITDIGTLGIPLVGTNLDTYNDYLESNWFGCIPGTNIDTNSPSASYTIRSNYFGFPQAGSTTGTLLPLKCRTSGKITLKLSGTAVVGSICLSVRV